MAASPDEINSSGTLNNKQLTNRLYYIKEHFSHSSMTTYRYINVTPSICATNVTSPTCVKNVTSSTYVTNVTSPTCVKTCCQTRTYRTPSVYIQRNTWWLYQVLIPRGWSLSNDEWPHIWSILCLRRCLNKCEYPATLIGWLGIYSRSLVLSWSHFGADT